MPTYDLTASFLRDLKRLTPQQRAAFKDAVRDFVADLGKNEPFRRALRVKPVRGAKGVLEMTWSMGGFDGRATFQFGDEVVDGERHVVWRRIGGHEIFKDA